MSDPQSPPSEPFVGTPPDQPHILSLTVQAKKALQWGEELCTKAHTLSSNSAQTAVDVLALDAQVRWMSEAVLDQLKFAAQVAKNIEQKRSELDVQVAEWDAIRNQRSDALDAILESLGVQSVPPDFHIVSTDSSPFGSQNPSEDEDDTTPFGLPHSNSNPRQSPTDTIRTRSPMARLQEKRSRRMDRRRWKTLRDFVDERAIEDLLDVIETDRQDLEKCLGQTSDYPESLAETIDAIKNRVPEEVELPSFSTVFKSQEDISVKMAEQLHSLVHHYHNMQDATHDFEAGEEFLDEDLQGMNADAEALSGIILELEEGVHSIETHGEVLSTAKVAAEERLDAHQLILKDLDELGEIMSDILEKQRLVEEDAIKHLGHMHLQLEPLAELHHKYTAYQHSYNQLVLELARRRQYHEAAQHIIANTITELDTMVAEERARRSGFQAEYGQYIPEDVCLYIENLPNRWTISTWHDEPLETLPEVEPDLIEEAKQRTCGVEMGIGASQSL
ncbi:autophagy protein Apg17-domain-containing protein [Lenzites betulinus]|nr:autophagy protein Apg17-domain-containing protein [Lenzites betulinus]